MDEARHEARDESGMGSEKNPGEAARNSESAPPAGGGRGKRSRLSRWLLWIGAVVLMLVVAAGIAIDVLLHRAEPMLRASLIDSLEKRFHSRVELDDLRVSMLDGFWVEGTGLRIWLPAEAQNNPAIQNAAGGQAGVLSEPWIVVAKMKFHASWRILPGEPIVISVIHVEGVRVMLPPKEQRPHFSKTGADSQDEPQAGTGGNGTEASAGQTPAQGQQDGKQGLFKMPRVEVGKIECQDATLIIERKQEAGKKFKMPLDFEFRKVTVIPDGKGGPMAFDVDMVNAKPIGIIHSTGKAGPWIPGDPGALPVEGDYKFDHADLSTIKGIAGMLSSTGHYQGTLRQIKADGQTQTPDFRLERVSQTPGVMLTTKFHAIVDGTNGDTWLQPVDAMLGSTHIVATGKVVRAEDVPVGPDGKRHGHDIQLQVTIDRGRIEDVLHISTEAEKAFVSGNLTLQTSFHLPPNVPNGQLSVWERLQLDGQFHLGQSRFSNDKMQGRIEQLSLRGQGRPKDVKTTDPESIFSDVRGHFKLGGGTLQLPDLDYTVPGAEILAHGSYGLQGGALNFEGDARLDATLSKIVGGWKGFLLKPADRYLRKNGAGTDVPIHVQGTRKEPKFGVDFDRLGKEDPDGQK